MPKRKMRHVPYRSPSDVKVTKADGTTEVQPALKRQEATKVIREGYFSVNERGKKIADDLWGDPYVVVKKSE